MKKLLKKLLPIVLASSFIVALPATISATPLVSSHSDFTTNLTAAKSIEYPSVNWSEIRLYKVKIKDPNSTLTVRSGPGTKYSKIGFLYSYDSASFNGSNSAGTWYHMCSSSGESLGWAQAKYLKLVK